METRERRETRGSGREKGARTWAPRSLAFSRDRFRESARAGTGAACLVKDVVVALPSVLRNDARLLQQVDRDVGAARHARRVEEDLHVLAEAGRVAVAQRLGVPKGCVKGSEHRSEPTFSAHARAWAILRGSRAPARSRPSMIGPDRTIRSSSVCIPSAASAARRRADAAVRKRTTWRAMVVFPDVRAAPCAVDCVSPRVRTRFGVAAESRCVPAPDSPVITTVWLLPVSTRLAYAAAAIEYTCGAGVAAAAAPGVSASKSWLRSSIWPRELYGFRNPRIGPIQVCVDRAVAGVGWGRVRARGVGRGAGAGCGAGLGVGGGQPRTVDQYGGARTS